MSNLQRHKDVVLIKLLTLALVITENVFFLFCGFPILNIIFLIIESIKVIDVVIKDLRVQNRSSQVQNRVYPERAL